MRLRLYLPNGKKEIVLHGGSIFLFQGTGFFFYGYLRKRRWKQPKKKDESNSDFSFISFLSGNPRNSYIRGRRRNHHVGRPEREKERCVQPNHDFLTAQETTLPRENVTSILDPSSIYHDSFTSWKETDVRLVTIW